ncbi:LutC/YkgG family protein [Desulfogranum japonicum]|uniref:LutC/YkgG family protein n=1 Tax=Desulfogranum japonicum TaxID=231447 RepID=UPI0006850132|nr:LUD domain-containing protein [Desulfogranum japonicum]
MNNQTSFINHLRFSCESSSQGKRLPSFKELVQSRAHTPPLSVAGTQDSTTQADLLKTLADNCVPLNLNLHITDHWHGAAQNIVDLALSAPLEFTRKKQIICHPSPAEKQMGLAALLTEHNLPCTLTDSPDIDLRELTIQSYIGITFPSFVIADTAAIVQLSEPQLPRSTSLVPSIHIAVATCSQLVPSLDTVYDQLSTMELPNALVFISGPSKTADIEAQMVHGAHGPREMHLVLVKSDVK